MDKNKNQMKVQFDSPLIDPHDDHVPKMVRKLCQLFICASNTTQFDYLCRMGDLLV